MNEMVVKKRDISSTVDFSPLVNLQVPSKIRKLVNIVHMFGKNKIKLTYSLTTSVLLLKVWNALPGSPHHKMQPIIPANLHWSTGKQNINGYV